MLVVKEVLVNMAKPSLALVSQTLDEVAELHPIDKVNWDVHAHVPQAAVRIAYNSDELFLKFTVKEESVRALHTANNSKVSTDSCCEFFVSPDANEYYYNFEFSCIGTMLMGYRKQGEAATRADELVMNMVRRCSTLGQEPFEARSGGVEWEMVIAIPRQAFFKHRLSTFKGLVFAANFYKCGDELPAPHYLSMFPIKTEKPSFHQPAYFSPLLFSCEKKLNTGK